MTAVDGEGGPAADGGPVALVTAAAHGIGAATCAALVAAGWRVVMADIDEDGLRELARLATGPDALEPEEAAQYWLVSRGLEEAPEGWFVPRDSWF